MPILVVQITCVLLAAGFINVTQAQENSSEQDAASPAISSTPDDVPKGLAGQKPPPITVAKWIKGEPLVAFEKGKVYVIDFWATWCGPCVAGIPHLTNLAQEHHGEIEVIGISISEEQENATDTSYIDAVQKFVDKKGERMDYRVAVDTPDKQMYQTWFKPAGTGGIPTAYIIDQNGLVAWSGIGSPAVVERIAKEVLAGSFDAESQRKREAEEAAAEAKAMAAAQAARANSPKPDDRFPGYLDAMKNNDTEAALKILNSAFEQDPKLELGSYQKKLMLLMQRNNVDEVQDYVRKLMENYPTNDDIIGFASACIVNISDREPRFDTKLSLDVARKAMELAEPDSRWAQFAKYRLGWAYYHHGEQAKATESMKAAVEGIDRLKDKFDFGDLAVDCEDALKLFQEPIRNK